VDLRELSCSSQGGESSATMEKRVQAAREVQLRRFRNKPTQTNSAMGSRLVGEHRALDAEAGSYLGQAMEQLNFL